MTPDDPRDALLQSRFAALRDDDARRAPAFADMLARARVAAADRPTAPLVAPPPRAEPAAWRRPRTWAFVTPFAVAAGLAGLWLQPGRVADREFERVVSEWSRTAERSRHSPTDALLAVPGGEYLRRLPALGGGAGSTWRPS
jgi:hypothetical protein